MDNFETQAKATIAAALIQSKVIDVSTLHSPLTTAQTQGALEDLRTVVNKVYEAITTHPVK